MKGLFWTLGAIVMTMASLSGIGAPVVFPGDGVGAAAVGVAFPTAGVFVETGMFALPASVGGNVGAGVAGA